jgi:uncharacterized protein YndB with AHSA1/START domain
MIRRQMVVPVTPERLWVALTDPDQVAGWFGARVEWELREGAPARFWSDDGSERQGWVVTVRPGRHLRFRWWPVPGGPEAPSPEAQSPENQGEAGPAGETVDRGDAGAGSASEVSYLLEPANEGTRLTIQERQLSEASITTPSARAGASTLGYSTVGSELDWTSWDHRLAGAWVALARRPAALVRG